MGTWKPALVRGFIIVCESLTVRVFSTTKIGGTESRRLEPIEWWKPQMGGEYEKKGGPGIFF